MRSFVICAHHPTLFKWANRRLWDRQGKGVVFMGKAEGEGLFGRPGHRWEIIELLGK